MAGYRSMGLQSQTWLRGLLEVIFNLKAVQHLPTLVIEQFLAFTPKLHLSSTVSGYYESGMGRECFLLIVWSVFMMLMASKKPKYYLNILYSLDLSN